MKPIEVLSTKQAYPVMIWNVYLSVVRNRRLCADVFQQHWKPFYFAQRRDV